MKGLYTILSVLAVLIVVGILALTRTNDRGSPVEAQSGITPVPTWTSTPEPVSWPNVVVNKQMSVREGPQLNYKPIGQANGGDRFAVTGVNEWGNWWQIDFKGQEGWVYANSVSAQNTDSVPVVEVAAPTRRPVPTVRPRATSTPSIASDLHIDLLSLLEYNRQFVGEEVYIEAEVIQVIGPQAEYTLIIYDGAGYGYLNLDGSRVAIFAGDTIKGIVEVSGTHTYDNLLGGKATVPLLYAIDLDLYR